MDSILRMYCATSEKKGDFYETLHVARSEFADLSLFGNLAACPDPERHKSVAVCASAANCGGHIHRIHGCVRKRV